MITEYFASCEDLLFHGVYFLTFLLKEKKKAAREHFSTEHGKQRSLAWYLEATDIGFALHSFISLLHKSICASVLPFPTQFCLTLLFPDKYNIEMSEKNEHLIV